MMQANWNSLGKPTVPLKSSPSTAQNTDGRLEVFSAGSDGALWHLWQTSADTPWSGWSSLNKPANTSLLVTAGIGKNADGRLEVFVIGSDGALWHNWQTAPEQGPWFNWFSSGRPSASIGNAQFPPSLAQNVDGRLEAFTVGTDGALWHIYQVAPNGIWSGWAPLGTPPNVHAVTVPIVGQNADGRLEVFTIGSDGALWHIWQTRPGQGPWSNWFSSGRPAASVSNTSPALAVSQNLDGRLEVFTVGSDGALWHLWQSRPNGTWSTWASLGFPTGASIPSPPTVGKNRDGRLEVLASGHDGALWHIWQTAPGKGWSAWDSLGAPPISAINSSPAVAAHADGRLEAFATGADGALWHCWQVAPGGPWGSSPPPDGTVSATVRITPRSKVLANRYVITAVTGTANPAQRQVQARIASATSPTQSKTVPSSGSFHGTRATGPVTFLNTSASAQSVASVTLRGASGVPVSFNGPVTVPAAPGFLTTPGFAVNVGSAGNIPALDIDGECCAQGIFVKNGAFSGGQDPRPNALVQQSDIDGAAHALSASLIPGTQAALRSQVQPHEQVVPSTQACQQSVTANHAAGDHALNVTVAVAVTCKEEVYDQQAALAMAQHLLTQEAVHEPGPNYQVTGSLVCSITQATVIDSQGTVSLIVQAQGSWVYTFSMSEQQSIKNHLAAKSKSVALSYLTAQPGVASAQIELSTGNILPGDPANIAIVIEPVEGAPPQLKLSANALTFTATAGNNPSPQTISITNSSSGPLSWTVAISSASWLSASPASGSIAAQQVSAVTFIANAAGLTQGVYNTIASITPTPDTSQMVAVVLEVL